MDTESDLTRALMKLADRIAEESSGAYYPVEFKMAIEKEGGLRVAKRLINQPVSEGFLRLVALKRTDLSVEALITETPRFQHLFTNVEITICRNRLDTH